MVLQKGWINIGTMFELCGGEVDDTVGAGGQLEGHARPNGRGLERARDDFIWLLERVHRFQVGARDRFAGDHPRRCRIAPFEDEFTFGFEVAVEHKNTRAVVRRVECHDNIEKWNLVVARKVGA